MGFPLSSFSLFHAPGRCIVGYCWRGMRGRRGVQQEAEGSISFFCQLRGHPCCASWMVVNHFESDVSINAASLSHPVRWVNEAAHAPEHCSKNPRIWCDLKTVGPSLKKKKNKKMARRLLAAGVAFAPRFKMVSLKGTVHTNDSFPRPKDEGRCGGSEAISPNMCLVKDHS